MQTIIYKTLKTLILKKISATNETCHKFNTHFLTHREQAQKTK